MASTKQSGYLRRQYLSCALTTYQCLCVVIHTHRHTHLYTKVAVHSLTPEQRGSTIRKAEEERGMRSVFISLLCGWMWFGQPILPFATEEEGCLSFLLLSFLLLSFLLLSFLFLSFLLLSFLFMSFLCVSVCVSHIHVCVCMFVYALVYCVCVC